MTETEKLLLSALERLQDDYETRQQAWQASYDSLQTMFTTTSAALMRSDQACQHL
ncbi:MbeD family mobilization/exclusion protein, partial [Escherichia coli]